MNPLRYLPTSLALALPLAAATVWAPAVADACSPPLPGLSDVHPPDGSTLPANAAVVLRGHALELDGLVATVDGAPVTIVQVGGLPGLGVRFDPAPGPGAQVEITGTPCAEFDSPCEPIALSWTVGAPDEVQPGGATTLSFDLWDHNDLEAEGGLCFGGSDFTWYIDGEVEPLNAGDGVAPEFIRLSRQIAGGEWRPWRQRFVYDGDFNFRAWVYGFAGELEGAHLPEDVCWRLEVIDTAGNAGAQSVTTCRPCHYRAGGPEIERFQEPEPPEWTEDDVYAEGPCALPHVEPDAGAGGTGGIAGGGGPDAGPGGAGGAGGAGGMGGAGGVGGDGGAGGEGGSGEQGRQRNEGCQSAQASAPLWLALLLPLALVRLRRRA